MQAGTIHKLILIFYQAFDKMNVQVDVKTVESLAVIVHKAMTLQARNYHNLDHVFTFVDPDDPIQTLAGLYHDIVYYQVDQGFAPEILEIVSPYIFEKDDLIFLDDKPILDDRLLGMTQDTFCLKGGCALSLSEGLNEFLSALVMNKQLGGLIREADSLKITTCIEATIPFRDRNHFFQLENSLQDICNKYVIPLNETDIEHSIQAAVKFANKDVENFAEQDVRKFLETTWKLLPEMNKALRSPDVYTIREFRQALFRMETSLTTLNPENVFHSFRGIPRDEELSQMVERVRHNIAIACEFLQIKLLAQAILEALAEVTGGDAPQVLFMGDLPEAGERSQRMEDYLPPAGEAAWVDNTSDIYKLLEAGSSDEAYFDLEASSLSSYLYKTLEPARLNQMIQIAKEMFNGQLNAQQFLDRLDRRTLVNVARASATIAVTRRDALMRFVD